MGSLFDGSGGFPLAAKRAGIKPIWASEIEPFPILVTANRISEMKHLGDIRQLNGAAIEPVDIITYGSPCTNWSHAGNREGLAGKQTSLFYEAIRVIREMRQATNNMYPSITLMENVLGIFSSKEGDDYHRVLEKIASCSGREVSIPRPAKWARAGTIVADDFSISWRVFDSKFWGVPQHRERVFIIGYFGEYGGGCKEPISGKILYNPEDVSRHSQKVAEQRENLTKTARNDTEVSSGGGYFPYEYSD